MAGWFDTLYKSTFFNRDIFDYFVADMSRGSYSEDLQLEHLDFRKSTQRYARDLFKRDNPMVADLYSTLLPYLHHGSNKWAASGLIDVGIWTWGISGLLTDNQEAFAMTSPDDFKPNCELFAASYLFAEAFSIINYVNNNPNASGLLLKSAPNEVMPVTFSEDVADGLYLSFALPVTRETITVNLFDINKVIGKV